MLDFLIIKQDVIADILTTIVLIMLIFRVWKLSGRVKRIEQFILDNFNE